MSADNDNRNPKNRTKKPSAVPKSDQPKTGQGKQKVEFKGYVNYSQDRIDKQQAAEYLSKPGWYAQALHRALTSGYKVSIMWDNYWDCFQGSLYCQDSESLSAGWCLTARADDPELAVFRVLFVHFVCLNEVWVTKSETRGYDPERW